MSPPEPEAAWEQYRTEPVRERFGVFAAALAALPVLVLFGASLRFGFAQALIPWILFSVVYGAALLLAVRASAGPDAVTVSAAGIRPTLREPGLVPAAQVKGFEVRKWLTEQPGKPYGSRGSCNLSLLLADGRYAILPALQRSELRGVPVRVMVSTSTSPDWTPLTDATGASALWERAGDAELTARLTTRIEASLDRSRIAEPRAELAITTVEGRHGRKLQTGNDERIWRTSFPVALDPGPG